jgi:hypothetical protein
MDIDACSIAEKICGRVWVLASEFGCEVLRALDGAEQLERQKASAS